MQTLKGSESWVSIQKNKGDPTEEAKPTYFIVIDYLGERRWTDELFALSALQDRQCIHLWSHWDCKR